MANKLHFYDIAQRVVQQIRRYGPAVILKAMFAKEEKVRPSPKPIKRYAAIQAMPTRLNATRCTVLSTLDPLV